MKENQAPRLRDQDCLEFFQMVNGILDRPTTDIILSLSQSRLRRYLVLERYYEIIKEAYEKERAELLTAVDQRLPQEEGDLIGLTEINERRNPKWKELVIQHMGKEYADNVLNTTRPTQSLKLVVTFRARLLEGGGTYFRRISEP